MTADSMLVGGRYELGEVLGRGGMAEVRHAVDGRLGRPVAVKQLRTDLATDPTFQARFRREAQSAAGLNHPNIVAVYDTGEETDPATGVEIPYIVMELVEGPTLRDVLRDGRKILPERALELTAGVLDALSYSHKAGIVHRDIKPANVMLTPSGGVKVMDFGIARAVADTSATVTQTAAVIGTAQYLSPEQARGETVDARSDLYSTGCLLYELLVGRPPFVGDSPVSVAYQHVREAPVPPSALDPEIGPDMDTITLKALAKDPADRYQSAREMKDDINRVLSGQQATAYLPRTADADDVATRVAPVGVAAPPPTGRAEPAPEEPRRRRGLLVALLVLALLAVGGGAYALYRANFGGGGTAATVQVPDVLTYTEAQARGRIEEEGLVAEVKQEEGAADTKGEVVGQDPTGGTEVASGSAVTITVNAGPDTTTVPENLKGKDLDDVRRRLEDAGFRVDAQEAETEPVSAKANEVLTVEPDEGETAAVGAEIRLTYATGRSPVPSLTQTLVDRAKATAEEAGFQTRVVREPSDQPEGLVLAQDPAAGEVSERGSTITLTVASPQRQARGDDEDDDDPTDEPTEEATDEATDEPTEDPTDEPTEEPTEDPTEEPTEEESEEPTEAPTTAPPTPNPRPSPRPTDRPSPTRTPRN